MGGGVCNGALTHPYANRGDSLVEMGRAELVGAVQGGVFTPAPRQARALRSGEAAEKGGVMVVRGRVALRG